MNQEDTISLLDDKKAWNKFRLDYPKWIPDISNIDLSNRDLSNLSLDGGYFQKSDFRNSKLVNSTLRGAFLTDADLRGADFTNANMYYARLIGAQLDDAKLDGAKLYGATLDEVSLIRSSLVGTDLRASHISCGKIVDSNLSSANLLSATLIGTDLTRSVFENAQLGSATLVQCTVEDAIFDNCFVYGISVWDLVGKAQSSKNLLISPESNVTVDELEFAQFVYLLLNNENIRTLFDTMSEKSVLILGRFTKDRKAVLDAIKNKLRELGFVPILFDFEKPTSRNFTETIQTLAGLCRFVVADITDPRSSPLELQALVPDYIIPFVPIIADGDKPFSMFTDLAARDWVLDLLSYRSVDELMEVFEDAVVRPALKKSNDISSAKSRTLHMQYTTEYL